MKIGLALGGGGARGFAHIGVLEVLEREKIPIDIMAGTSMGAVMGAVYALTPSVAALYEKVRDISRDPKICELEMSFTKAVENKRQERVPFHKTLSMIKELYVWNMRALKRWLIDYKPFEPLFHHLYGDKTFQDCVIPFAAVATDLVDGNSAYLQEGPLYEAVLASIALPGVFPPMRKGHQFLVDGGILEPVPIDALSGKADVIIGVNLELKRRVRHWHSSLDVLLGCDELRHNKLVENTLKRADFLIEPDVNDYFWADFSHKDEIIEKGRIAAEERLPDLRLLLRRRRYFSFFNGSLSGKKR
jgi:NTE family protein